MGTTEHISKWTRAPPVHADEGGLGEAGGVHGRRLTVAVLAVLDLDERLLGQPDQPEDAEAVRVGLLAVEDGPVDDELPQVVQGGVALGSRRATAPGPALVDTVEAPVVQPVVDVEREGAVLAVERVVDVSREGADVVDRSSQPVQQVLGPGTARLRNAGRRIGLEERPGTGCTPPARVRSREMGKGSPVPLAVSYVLPLLASDAEDRRLPGIRHLRPSVDVPNGKVANVLTGLRHARHEVRPHNRFVPAPWHARWDTWRTPVALALGGDRPDTLVVRRSAGGGRERVLHDLIVPRRPPTTRRSLRHARPATAAQWAPARARGGVAFGGVRFRCPAHRHPSKVMDDRVAA